MSNKRLPLFKKVDGLVNHERHWHFLSERGEPEAVVNEILNIMISKQEAVAVEVDSFFHVIDRNKDLKLAFLPDVAAFPYCEQGFVWNLEVKEVLEWPSGKEAQLLSNCHGARVGFFDSSYLLSRSQIQLEEKQKYVVNGIGYLISEGEVPEGYAHDFCGFMSAEAQGGEMDEIQFHSRIEAIDELDFWGVSLLVFTVTLAIIDEIPLKTRLFYAKNSKASSFKVSDRVVGFAWLFGVRSF